MRIARRLIRHLRSRAGRWPDSFLWDTESVVHVGANVGQERDMYQHMDLTVAWIEPITEVFLQLRENLTDYPKQRALQALVTDRDGAIHQMHVASNNGESSSILKPAEHLSLWPDISFATSLSLTSVTLPTLIERESVQLSNRNALVIDTQGSELMVLQGARTVLPEFLYVKVEAPDFEGYENCASIDSIEKFMTDNGFKFHSQHTNVTSRFGEGKYYDLVYKRLG